MSKAFITSSIQTSIGCSKAASRQAADDLLDAITTTLNSDGRFTLPGFGTFMVRNTKARVGLNPRTGEKINIQSGKTVRFKASKALKEAV